MRTVTGSANFGVPAPGTVMARARPGRPCDVEGCATILSTYNTSDVCWLHADAGYRHAPRRSRPAVGIVVIPPSLLR